MDRRSLGARAMPGRCRPQPAPAAADPDVHRRNSHEYPGDAFGDASARGHSVTKPYLQDREGRDGGVCRRTWVSGRPPPSLPMCSTAPSKQPLPTANGLPTFTWCLDGAEGWLYVSYVVDLFPRGVWSAGRCRPPDCWLQPSPTRW